VGHPLTAASRFELSGALVSANAY